MTNKYTDRQPISFKWGLPFRVEVSCVHLKLYRLLRRTSDKSLKYLGFFLHVTGHLVIKVEQRGN